MDYISNFHALKSTFLLFMKKAVVESQPERQWKNIIPDAKRGVHVDEFFIQTRVELNPHFDIRITLK